MLPLTLLLYSLFFQTVRALAVVEPNDGTAYLGAWIDTAAATQSSIPGDITIGDTPLAWNERMNLTAASFQFAQNIPLDPYDWVTGSGGPINITMIEETQTSASVFLTVYPYTGLDRVSNADMQDLGNQILQYQTTYNRSVFLRYAPEMNGQWMSYGAKPYEFVQQWQTLWSIVKRIAPDTAFVWAPNFGQGYPFQLDFASVSAQDQALLDTNHDGILDAQDDPYSPFYPGDQYVDWNGMSLYYKGGAYPYILNEQQPDAYISSNLDHFSFYDTYCVKAVKPCCIAESGSAWHVNDGGISQHLLQYNWHSQFLSNASFYSAYPKLKMINLFEHQKIEDLNDLRDFRLSIDTRVREEFVDAIQPLLGKTLLQASSITTSATSNDSNGLGSSATAANDAKSSSWKLMPKGLVVFATVSYGLLYL